MRVHESRSFADVEQEYMRFCSDICQQLGWDLPWVFAQRMVDESGAFLQPLYTVFLRSYEIRSTNPALFPFFPVHPLSKDAASYVGLPMLAASDSSFGFFLTTNSDSGGPWSRFAANAGTDEAMVALDVMLRVSNCLDQLMQIQGKFDDLVGDPLGITDEFTLAESAAEEQIMRMYLPPLANIVFD